MFYDLYVALCVEKKISPTRAATEIGISKATPTTWKKRGLTPQGDTLNKIAAYFNVTTDYLLGSDSKESSSPISMDAFTYAMHEEGKELTEENKKKLIEMAQFFKQQQEREQQP